MSRRRAPSADLRESAHKPLNRRRFLQMLAAAGGTGVMLGAMDALGVGIASAQDAPPPLSGRADGVRVLILGAGLAGMTAAYELARLGYETTVLEARDFVGGRCQTARRGFTLGELGGETQRCDFDDGQYLNHGPWRIPYHHRSVLHYTREFGVPLEIMVNDNPAAYALIEEGEGPLANTRQRRMKAMADSRGYTAELLAKAASQDRLEQPLERGDKERLVEYLTYHGFLERGDLAYRGTDARGYEVDPGAGTDPGPGVPSDPWDFGALLRSNLWWTYRALSSYSQQPTMFQPVGGMDRIARAFERAVGDSVVTRAEVQEIRQSSDGVRVAFRDPASGQSGAMEADVCICTLPLSVLANVDADFAPEFQRAIARTSYVPTGKIGLQFARRFWETEDGIYGGHSHTDFFGNISYPSYGWQQPKGVVLGYYNFGSTAIRVSGMSPADRTEYALENGSRLHPGHYREAFETSFSVAWHRVPYSLGGWADWSDSDRLRAYPLLNEPDGRVYLAGEHLSYLTGWQAGAIESAWQQIEKLHRRVRQAGLGGGALG